MSGFGMLARIGGMHGAFPGWVWVKLIIWGTVAVALMVPSRRPGLWRPFLLALPLLGALAAYMAIYKPSETSTGLRARAIMRVLSVNVGRPREVAWRGKAVQTGIFKAPVTGRIVVTRSNLAGDEQADLSVHGGADKALYAYPGEHYAFWREELPGVAFPWGAFGENLTTEGLLETTIRVGDHLRIGSTDLMVTQPRMPCFKLGLRFGRPDMVKRFLRSGRTGFYLAVLQVGDVGAGDAVEHVAGDESGLSVADVAGLYNAKAANQDLLRRASQIAALSQSWRDHFATRLRDADAAM